MQQARERQHHHDAPNDRPNPPFTQITDKIEQIAQPECRQQKWEHEGAETEKKRRIGDVCTVGPDQIVYRVVGRRAVGTQSSDRTNPRDQQQQRRRQQRDADNVVEAIARTCWHLA